MKLFDPHDIVTTGQLAPFPATAINNQTLPCHILQGLFDCFKAFDVIRPVSNFKVVAHRSSFSSECTRRYSCFVVIEGQIGNRPYEDAGEQRRSRAGYAHCIVACVERVKLRLRWSGAFRRHTAFRKKVSDQIRQRARLKQSALVKCRGVADQLAPAGIALAVWLRNGPYL